MYLERKKSIFSLYFIMVFLNLKTTDFLYFVEERDTGEYTTFFGCPQ